MLAYEARQLRRLAEGLGIRVGRDSWVNGVGGQSVFHESQFTLLLHDFERHGNKLGFAYFHGRPGTPGFPEFDASYDALRRRHAEIDRVQVTNRAMEKVVLETGLAPEKVHRIPIGVDLAMHRLHTADVRTAARRELGLPEAAFVVGSFQKDGVGWGEGLEPKLIKGPDVLVGSGRTATRACSRPLVPAHRPCARVRDGRARSDRRALPARPLPHRRGRRRSRTTPSTSAWWPRVTRAAPRAVLEAMATGVPLVTTRVGQAADLVRHGENGWMVDVEDVDALVEWSLHVAEAPAADLENVLRQGLQTAAENSYDALTPRWRALLDGFVDIPMTSER